MLHKMYAIFDTKAEAYLPPFYLPNDAMAVRAITDCVNDPKHQFNAHPMDYVLFALGTFSDSDATFDHPVPAVLVKLHELRSSEDQLPLFNEDPS